MRRDQLEHIIRAAAAVTKQNDLIIIGSQAILGQYPNAPEPLLVSMEADIYAPGAPHLSDYIDGALGPDTAFDTTHGIREARCVRTARTVRIIRRRLRLATAPPNRTVFQ